MSLFSRSIFSASLFGGVIGGIPADALLAEDGSAILAENGNNILVDN